LIEAINECISVALYSNDIESLNQLFDEEASDVSPKLKELIKSIIHQRLEVWREVAISNRVSLPKYHDINWEIHLKRASSEVILLIIIT
jgi:hypothetical protein